jgi:hypothetical protein
MTVQSNDSGESQRETCDQVLADFVSQVAYPDATSLHAWIHRYPRFARELVENALIRAQSATALPHVAPASEAVDYILAILAGEEVDESGEVWPAVPEEQDIAAFESWAEGIPGFLRAVAEAPDSEVGQTVGRVPEHVPSADSSSAPPRATVPEFIYMRVGQNDPTLEVDEDNVPCGLVELAAARELGVQTLADDLHLSTRLVLLIGRWLISDIPDRLHRLVSERLKVPEDVVRRRYTGYIIGNTWLEQYARVHAKRFARVAMRDNSDVYAFADAVREDPDMPEAWKAEWLAASNSPNDS